MNLTTELINGRLDELAGAISDSPGYDTRENPYTELQTALSEFADWKRDEINVQGRANIATLHRELGELQAQKVEYKPA